jgi:hypothetical protein
LFGLAKETLNTMYFDCIEGINQVQREAWKIYKNEDNNPEINQWHRMTALKIIRNCNDSKFNMYSHDREQPLFEQTNTTFEDFHNMIDSYGWESEGYDIVVANNFLHDS